MLSPDSYESVPTDSPPTLLSQRTSRPPGAEGFQQRVREVGEEKVRHAQVPMHVAQHLQVNLVQGSVGSVRSVCFHVEAEESHF